MTGESERAILQSRWEVAFIGVCTMLVGWRRSRDSVRDGHLVADDSTARRRPPHSCDWNGYPLEGCPMSSERAISQPPTPSNTDDLELVRERKRQPVNEFLEQRHPLGSVPGWKACFSARYRDSIVAVVIVGRPVARQADDGRELSITRFCRRDDRPANTGSWLIARARQWAALEGYDTLSAHAGVAGNYGTVYEAAGFECTGVTMADGRGWLRHGDDRDSWDDYERRKWEVSL